MTSQLLKTTYTLNKPIHGSICNERKVYSCPSILQISCGVENLIALHGMGFIQVEKLLNMILDTAGPCWTWLLTPALQWSTKENTDVMHVCVISVSHFAIRIRGFCSDNSFCPTKKKPNLCVASLFT